MKKIIIFGANSDIVLSTCKYLLNSNTKITLIGRDKNKIKNNYKDFEKIIDKIYEIDLSNLASINNLFENNIDPVEFDLVILSHGVINYEDDNFYSIDNIFKVNTLSIILIVNLFLKKERKFTFCSIIKCGW